MTDRIARMLEKAVNAPISLGIEKIKIALKTLEHTTGLSNFAARSELLASYLRELSVCIPEDDLIAGTGSSYFNGAELDYETGVWTKSELDSLFHDCPGMYYISPEDEAELVALEEQLDKAWSNTHHFGTELTWDNDRLRPFLKSGVTMPVIKERNSGKTYPIGQTGIGVGPGATLCCLEYERVLNEGARALIDEAKECLKNERCITEEAYRKHEYWTCAVKILEAWISYAHRCADEADRQAAECTDPARKAELVRMAEACRRVPEYPARTFYEAIQAFWFTFLAHCSNTMAGGRIDQFLYPFYKRDKEAGILTDEQALELIENIRVKTASFHTVKGSLKRGNHSGNARWHNFIIGGCDAQGNDASNELTMMFMQSALELKVPHHTITLRVGEYTPLEVVKKGVEVVAAGVGMPAFVSDKSYIGFFTNLGYAVEDARNYAICGCLDAVIPGLTRTQGVIFYNQPQVMDIFLHNGYCRFTGEEIGLKTGDPCDFPDYDSFVEGFYKQHLYFMELACERMCIGSAGRSFASSDPFRSLLLHDGIKCGIPMESRRFEPFDNSDAVMAVGGANIANGLAAIKKLIYEEKKYTMRQLIDALDADWEGYEEMRADFLKAPKYGNNDDYVDSIITDLYTRFAKEAALFPNAHGDHCVPSGISISAHQPSGKCVPASPDGRKAWEILADGMISPQQGTDYCGPLAVFQSAMKIPQDDYQATLFNMKFTPSALKTDADKMKLATVVKTYLTHGGKQIQFSVVARETLEKAQADPAQYKNVIVRVAGYSAYFVTLTNMMQNEIISRTTNEEV